MSRERYQSYLVDLEKPDTSLPPIQCKILDDASHRHSREFRECISSPWPHYERPFESVEGYMLGDDGRFFGLIIRDDSRVADPTRCVLTLSSFQLLIQFNTNSVHLVRCHGDPPPPISAPSVYRDQDDWLAYIMCPSCLAPHVPMT